MDYREIFKGMTLNQLVEVAVRYAEDAEKTVVENYKLRAEMKKLDDRITMHKEEIDAGDRRIVDMEKTIDELRTQAEDRENFILGLENDFNKVKTDWKARECHLCDKIESKNGLIGTLRSQLDSAKNTIEALKSRNNDNNEVTTDLELNNRKLMARIQELEKQLKQAAELGDVCMDRIRDLEMKNGKLNEEIKNYAELIKENDSLHNRIYNLTNANNQLDDRVKEMIELKDHLYERIREFEKRNNELTIELDEYKHAYEHAREECDKLTPLKRRVDPLATAESFAADVKAKDPEEPVCKTVPCSTVIGKLENYWVNSEGVKIQVRLSEKASAYFKSTKPHIIGEDIDIKDLQMKMPDLLQKNMDEFVAKRNKLFDEGCDNYLMKYCTTNIEAKAKHIKNKYDALRKVGFTDDQAMSMLPMWDDEDYV